MHSQKKNKSIEEDPRMTGMIKLAGKDFETTIINMLKGKMVLLNKHTGNLNKHMEIIKEEPSGNSRTDKHN